ncbi:MAG: (d)CMP kinase [bacterium]
MKKKKIIVTIDGPAGSGKTTVASLTAGKLGYLHIDSGSMYRGLTWKVLQKKINLNDTPGIIKTVRRTKLVLKQGRGKNKVLIDGKDVTAKLRTAEINANINTVAAIPAVRQCLMKIQHWLGKKGGIVMEGRDIGTVVFPRAEKKFYLDASIKERAVRRFKELREAGKRADLADIERSIRRRDKKDQTRRTHPLRIPEDAVVIDTTGLSIKQVTARILEEIEK